MPNIYFFGDTHNNIDIDKIFLPTYNADDFIIVCGDFGVLWDYKFNNIHYSKGEKRLIKRIESLPCTLLFVDGNHENFHRLAQLKSVERFGADCGEYLTDKCYHLKRGRIYNIAGYNIFTMGGALSVDKAYRVPNKSWWRGEAITDEQMELGISNITNFSDKIDIAVTHTCPYSFLGELGRRIQIEHKMHDENPLRLERLYGTMIDNNKVPKWWFFGHWHSDVSFEVGDISVYCLYYRAMKLISKNIVERLDYTKEILEIKSKKK